MLFISTTIVRIKSSAGVHFNAFLSFKGSMEKNYLSFPCTDLEVSFFSANERPTSDRRGLHVELEIKCYGKYDLSSEIKLKKLDVCDEG